MHRNKSRNLPQKVLQTNVNELYNKRRYRFQEAVPLPGEQWAESDDKLLDGSPHERGRSIKMYHNEIFYDSDKMKNMSESKPIDSRQKYRQDTIKP